ncbi:GNAT family N-acetyltransferase [Mycobacterium barrassiae]|uniref:GNAT family N-acetyltransferase n=1 Tax=Mycobacterium barrassiae TaxID=319709 RepID=UPI002265CA4A|nr:GNAT family N-acetyltransferase [Mycobacterium barrassiae]MCV7298907.1 GNAT family N-acetyltransferase [Mycobacterium barrassiae]
MAAELDFRHVSAEDGDGAALLAAMVEEMRELYWDIGDGLDLTSPDMPAAGPAELSPPGGAYLVGYRDGRPVCGGGIKRLSDDACEIKRMYVVPAARGQGLAKALLHALEDAAQHIGYAVVRLDTGPRQPHARDLYLAHGYREIGNFNGNPVATFFGEKRLSGD